MIKALIILAWLIVAAASIVIIGFLLTRAVI